MIIVSQDKTKVINFERLNYIQISKVDEKKSIIEINYSDCNFLIIAEYETEERAKEVLQEIVKQKAMFELYKTAPAGGKEQAEMLDMFTKQNIILDTYEMPEE